MKTKYKNDPTDDYDEIKELTPEEVYYAIEDLEVPEPCEIYITHLERTIRLLKQPKTSITKTDLLNLTRPPLWKPTKL